MANVTDRSTAPSFVLLTSGGIDGRRVASILHRSGILYDLVLIAHPRRKKGRRSFLSYLPIWIRDHLAGFYLLRRLRQRKFPSYPVRGKFCGRVNSRRLKNYLSDLAPDYIIMMGGGILDDETIQMATQGVLNVHPALLPWVRGVGVLLHSVARQIPLGATGHFIDPGIDTGAIIARYKLPVLADEQLGQIKKKSQRLCCAIMIDLVRQAHEGFILKGEPQTEKHDLCTTMPTEDKQRITECIKNGEAAQLYTADFKGGTEKIEDGTTLLEQYANFLDDETSV